MKLYNDLIQGTDEWLQIRLGKFGGTDAQAVAANGKGLETLAFEKVAEILTGRSKTFYTNEHMERGNEFEQVARSIYELETGTTVEQIGYVEQSEYVGVSPDGLVGIDGLIEIKCPSDAVFVRFMYDNKVDTKYEWQMQHQMYVTERKWCDYVVFNDNFNKIITTRISRDDAKITKLQEGLTKGVSIIEEILAKVK